MMILLTAVKKKTKLIPFWPELGLYFNALQLKYYLI